MVYKICPQMSPSDSTKVLKYWMTSHGYLVVTFTRDIYVGSGSPEKDVCFANSGQTQLQTTTEVYCHSKELQRLWGRIRGGWSGRQEEAISNPVMSFIFHKYIWKHHETAKTVEQKCGKGEESGGSEGEADK
jgi:hypothetical protein